MADTCPDGSPRQTKEEGHCQDDAAGSTTDAVLERPSPNGDVLVASPSSSSRSSASSASQQRVCRCEANEWGTLSLGPFEAGVTCEILGAWYGVKDEPSRQWDVTEKVKRQWEEGRGLRISGFNRLFGDPAMFRQKTLIVEYRMSIRSWDVSHSKFKSKLTEQWQMLPVMGMKALLNVVGAGVAAGSFAVGKAQTVVSSTLTDSEASVADSTIFQSGFRAWCYLNGIVPSLTYDDGLEDMRTTPLIVSNHMCYLDGLVLAAILGAPKVLAMQGTLKTPLIGFFAEEIGVIEVDRGDKASRAATLRAITDHVEGWRKGSRPLLLFPEGTTSNGDGILPFKKGAFVPGAPVRPLVLTYTGDWHPANTNYKTTSSGDLEATGDLEWCQQFLGHAIHSVAVRVLPPYEPSPQEKAEPQLFANNVQVLMSEAYEQLRREVERKGQITWKAQFLDAAADARNRLFRLGSEVLNLEALPDSPAPQPRRESAAQQPRRRGQQTVRLHGHPAPAAPA